MPVRLQWPKLHRLQDSSCPGASVHLSGSSAEDPNLSSGKVVEYLLRVLRAASSQ